MKIQTLIKREKLSEKTSSIYLQILLIVQSEIPFRCYYAEPFYKVSHSQNLIY